MRRAAISLPRWSKIVGFQFCRVNVTPSTLPLQGNSVEAVSCCAAGWLCHFKASDFLSVKLEFELCTDWWRVDLLGNYSFISKHIINTSLTSFRCKHDVIYIVVEGITLNTRSTSYKPLRLCYKINHQSLISVISTFPLSISRSS